MKLRYPLLPPPDAVRQSKIATLAENLISVIWTACLVLGAIALFSGVALH